MSTLSFSLYLGVIATFCISASAESNILIFPKQGYVDCALAARGGSVDPTNLVSMNKYRQPTMKLGSIDLKIESETLNKRVDGIQIMIAPLKPKTIPLDDLIIALTLGKFDRLSSEREIDDAKLTLHWVANQRVASILLSDDLSSDTYALGSFGLEELEPGEKGNHWGELDRNQRADLVMERVSRIIYLMWLDIKPDQLPQKVTGRHNEVAPPTQNILPLILQRLTIKKPHRALLLAAYMAGVGHEYMARNEETFAQIFEIWLSMNPQESQNQNPYFTQAMIEMDEATKKSRTLKNIFWASQ